MKHELRRALALGVMTLVGCQMAGSGITDTPTATTTATSSPDSTLLPTITPTLSISGRIMFVSDRDGNDEIYAMNADGSDQSNLTHNPATDSFPAWLPDGSKIAFVSDRAGDYQIYVMNADGSGLTQFTDGSQCASFPAWSPDGHTIAVAYGESAYNLFGNGFLTWMEHGKVMLIDAQSGVVVRTLKGHSSGVQRVAFSPDGTKLASSSQDGTVIIWQVK